MVLTKSSCRQIAIFILSLSLLVILASIVVMSLVPPVSRDALVHHLAIPKLYLKHGGIYEIPFMDFSYYPMNLDLLYMIPLYLGNDIIPKLIHFSFALLTAWLIFSYLKKRAGLVYGLSGAVFFLSIPVIVKLSINVYVDLGLIFFSFTALLLILKWMNDGFKIKYLICSGGMCGLALGTKYNGLITFVLLALFIPYLYSRYSKDKKQINRKSLIYFFYFVFTAIIIFSPWMIRNYCWKGNPVYPLYNTVFNPPAQATANSIKGNLEKKVLQNRGLFTYRHIIYKESGLEIFMLPLRIFFQGQDDDPRFFDGRLNPFLLFFSIFAFFPVKKGPVTIRRENLIMLSFSILYILIAMFTTAMRIRYISPVIPAFSVLSIMGVKNLFELIKAGPSDIRNRAYNIFVIFLFMICLSMNAVYIRDLFVKVDPLPSIKGRITRDEYISKFIPEYPALKYINENLPQDSKILFVYIGRRGYYCDRDYVTDEGMLPGIILNASKPEEILSLLQKRGITHILVSFPVFDKWVKDNCSTARQEMINAFFRGYTLPAFYKNSIGLNILKYVD